MKILVDDNNLITAFATVGGFDDDIEVDDTILPSTFVDEFKAGKFSYIDGKIVYNKSYQPETPVQPTTPSQPAMSDDTLKYMVATLQKQSVQSNMKINKLLKDNQDLKNKVSELENKEVTANE